jgi:hypothetical protein
MVFELLMDEGDMFQQNVRNQLPSNMASHFGKT